jgi:putative phosphoribosyl transferase
MFHDRKDAGIQLAETLKHYKGNSSVLVLALPRGGVVVGFEIARYLNVPMDVFIVRKIGFPTEPEFAIGSVSETGTVYLNQSVISAYGVADKYIADETAHQKEEIAKKVKLYREGKKIGGLENKIIILVDDGVATGATMKAAITTLKKEKIEKLVIALPVAPPSTAAELKEMADEFICLETPYDFFAVGSYYHNFKQVSDVEVIELLQKTHTSSE